MTGKTLGGDASDGPSGGTGKHWSRLKVLIIVLARRV